MIVRLACGALQGVDAFRVDLEVDFLRKGMPAFVMVGLAEGGPAGKTGNGDSINTEAFREGA